MSHMGISRKGSVAEEIAGAEVLRWERVWHVGGAERRSVRLERKIEGGAGRDEFKDCLLYTSDAADD